MPLMRWKKVSVEGGCEVLVVEVMVRGWMGMRSAGEEGEWDGM